MKNYPDTELSDNAQYWIGESFYIQRKFSEAIQGFDKVLTNYPKGDKAPAAALKKGYSLLETKNNDAGIRELRQLIQKYPNSDSAQLAKDRLNAMGISATERPHPREGVEDSRVIARRRMDRSFSYGFGRLHLSILTIRGTGGEHGELSEQSHSCG